MLPLSCLQLCFLQFCNWQKYRAIDIEYIIIHIYSVSFCWFLSRGSNHRGNGTSKYLTIMFQHCLFHVKQNTLHFSTWATNYYHKLNSKEIGTGIAFHLPSDLICNQNHIIMVHFTHFEGWLYLGVEELNKIMAPVFSPRVVGGLT